MEQIFVVFSEYLNFMEQVVNVARKSCNSRANVRNPSLLKVSKSRKQFLEFSILPKKERKMAEKNL